MNYITYFFLLSSFLVSQSRADASSVRSLRRRLPVGGSAADSLQFPYFVELVSSTGRRCGGTLILPDIVLTAAVCTYSADGQSRAEAVISQAYVKGSDTGTLKGTSRSWGAYAVHPGYTFGNNTNNIAVIHLIIASIAAISPINDNANVPPVGSSVLSPGYGTGSTDASQGSADLQVAMLTVIAESNTSCSTGNENSLICADSNSQDMCAGDEGGPLIFSNEIVGVYSHGGKCNAATGEPKFSRVSYFKSFVDDQACQFNSVYCTCWALWMKRISSCVNAIFRN